MRAFLICAVIAAVLSGCTHDSVEPTAQPTVPVFDAAESWDGANSPVLDWSTAQRDTFMRQYDETVSAALAKAGLPNDLPPDATAIDSLQRAEAIGSAVPRPAREIALLVTVDDRTSTTLDGADEATALDTAWKVCARLAQGESYQDLVFKASATFEASARTASDTSELAAALYAPIICPEHAPDALTTIAGVDGPDALP